jgi:DNA-binding CsgD family transcriptional regulator
VPLVGRDREIQLIEQALSAMAHGTRFVVLRGEPGIGKTSLWRLGVRRHRLAGHRALVTRAVEDELPAPMVGLADLFDGLDVDEAVLAADTDPYDRARAVLATFRRLADESPLLVAVDDLQWLDPVSARVLRHALARLDHEPVLVLATERADARTGTGTGPGGPEAGGPERSILGDRREEIDVGPLPIDATRALLATAGEAVPRPVLERIQDLSGGNPMFALELAGGAASDRDLAAGRSPTLGGLLADRLAAVPDQLLSVLQVVAALGPSGSDTIARAYDGGGVRSLLSTAVERGLLQVGDDLHVHFTHPLLASAVLADLDPFRRQDLHARLVDVVDDPDARARHLALSSGAPDAAVAAELDAASARAARRGASSLAADLADHAVRVTPPSDLLQLVRRGFAAVMHRAAAGERVRALARCDDLIGVLPRGPARAMAITLRVGLDFADGDRYLEQALAEAGGDEVLQGRILELRGWMAVTYRAEPVRGLALAEAALAIAARHEDPALQMLAASSVSLAALVLGRPRPELMRSAMRLAGAHEGPRLGRWPQSSYARECLWCGRLDEARTLLENLYGEFLNAGMEFQRPFRLLDLAELEVAAGRLERAARLAADGIDAATDAGNTQARAWLGFPAGLAAVHLGDDAGVADAIALLRSHEDDPDGATRAIMAGHLLGLHALSRGEPAAALAEWQPVVARLREVGVRLPSVITAVPDAIEAAAMAGDIEACSALSGELDDHAAAIAEPWVDAVARRGQGLVALAEGRAEAVDLLAGAADAFDALGYRIDAARSLLLSGRALLRAGRRSAAADTIAEARRRFAAMGAAGWLRQAEAELDRASPGREQSALTPTEQRIAALAVAGRRNREIAGELFISVATVEAHLTRIYRKLGVRSRVELARVLS